MSGTCVDCGHVFSDRSETQWDVRRSDGSYGVVCSDCFRKRESAPVVLDPDAPVEGSTAVLELKKNSPRRKR